MLVAILVEDQMITVKWNNGTRSYYIGKGYEYTETGKEFLISVKDLTKHSKVEVKLICDNEKCKKEFIRPYGQAMRNEYQYCTHKCSTVHQSEMKLNKRIKVECEHCSETYAVPKGVAERTRFCSRECMAKWQSEAFKGSGSSKYVERITVQCDYCKNEVQKTPNQVSLTTYHFCSNDCRNSYHREVYMLLPEVVERNRQVMINNLNNGLISFTESKPQLIVNDLLDQLNIKYENEKPLIYYSLDNYLVDYDLYIEVNGGYWHCDNRQYKQINYEQQVKRIVSDKRKNTYVKDNLGKRILYLWEYDIETNPELCTELIKLYVKEKGVISNYHSFNYCINDANELNLNKKIIKPYMDYQPKKLNDIIDLEIKEKTNRQINLIYFECEHCNKESNQPSYQYIKSKNHFCSKECSLSFLKRGTKVHPCTYCSSDITLPEHRVKFLEEGRQSNVFCSKTCKNKWQSENHNKTKQLFDLNCLNCNNIYSVPKHRKDKSKYCSHDCRQKHSRKKFLFNCEQCSKECETTPSKYNKSKNHFCSNKCADKFRSEQAYENRTCENCSKEYRTKKVSKQRFCNPKCQNTWQSKALVGKNANNYKHGRNVKD